MSTEAAPATVNASEATTRDATRANLREYGLVLALIAIMVFFQAVTSPQFNAWWTNWDGFGSVPGQIYDAIVNFGPAMVGSPGTELEFAL